MKELDGDGKPLESGGVKAMRDIVQFVQFEEIKEAGGAESLVQNMAKACLSELPKQFESYFLNKKITPNPR